MTKYLIAALVAVLAFGGMYLWAQEGWSRAQLAQANAKVIATQLEDAKASLRAANQAAEVNRKVAASRLAAAEAQRKAAERRAKDLSDALKDNPDWAAQPVPDSVWDALRPEDGKAAP